MSESRQAGFTLLGVLIAVMIIGIMATVAVPKFSSTIITANTAKVQSDLNTLDAAIAVYQLENGHEPANLNALQGYVNDLDSLRPPKGKCRLKGGEILTLDGDARYGLRLSEDQSIEGARAICAEHTAGEFGNGK
ncbi:MAG: prepilin-type N-terminal cleavage/methylation domain-containing protein [Selenomonas sp.]|uniref:type II secretion system protein n=1 Tax=Selenomonas sp. TaxID=2053611 RepID=UPI0025FD1C02|nr:prepilin-type N-terminal cleavage/methylation domain-containing protein [Selenomonas sp.]MCR5757673.1 prepilin-type N-terminal cleavage/methylation domain-containing protein [Selenomonas sp.]